MPTRLDPNDVITPTDAEAAVAKESSRARALHVGGDAPLRLRVVSGSRLDELVLPAAAARVLLGELTETGEGNAVSVAPVRAELTTNEAAEVLNVSRPRLMRLLDDGVLPFRKVGSHHRGRRADVLAYHQDQYAKRKAALDELTALGHDLGLYDDPTK